MCGDCWNAAMGAPAAAVAARFAWVGYKDRIPFVRSRKAAPSPSPEAEARTEVEVEVELELEPEVEAELEVEAGVDPDGSIEADELVDAGASPP